MKYKIHTHSSVLPFILNNSQHKKTVLSCVHNYLSFLTCNFWNVALDSINFSYVIVLPFKWMYVWPWGLVYNPNFQEYCQFEDSLGLYSEFQPL